jgi:hypothetical protein
MTELCNRVEVVLVLESKDHPAFNDQRFMAFVDQEFAKWKATLPSDVEYVLLQDFTPVKLPTAFHTLSTAANANAPVIRQMVTYDARTDSKCVRFEAAYLVPVETSEHKGPINAPAPAVTASANTVIKSMKDMTPAEVEQFVLKQKAEANKS